MMKRLLTATALTASMMFATTAMADSHNTDSIRNQVENLKNETLNKTNNVLSTKGDATVMAATAISARHLIGANVNGPDGKKVGTVNDLVLSGDDVEHIIVRDGGVLGFGGKDVALDFEGAVVTRDEDANRTVNIGITKEALDEVSEFNKEPLEKSGSRLASAYLDREVTLGGTDTRAGTIRDLVIDKDGNVEYAVIGFGGLLGMGQSEVAVEFDKLGKAPEGEAMSLSLSEDQLRKAPAFKYNKIDR